MNDLPADWLDRLRRMDRSPTALAERKLFQELNPDLAHTPILSQPPSKPRPASVLIPILNRSEGPTILFTVRAPTMPSHAGQISLPGGGPKPPDATPVDTALREASEEVGLSAAHVEVVAQFAPHHGGLGYRVTPVVGWVADVPDLIACDREVSAMFEVPLLHILNREQHIVETRNAAGTDYQMYAVPYDTGEEVHHIWGLTAGILHTLALAFEEEADG
ncbi:CoA pyrophosphatase [Parvularcula sp. LCG005]|uniref:CoA pyrophosphatase n=1 Tax=Parvularcula sp. LCG005 TaxID=3078805 RepID=UPI002942C0EE|nr:CoA pyrophosphatase [Parvularcula sp. LCG005]WOI52030.1 CoA pyrophosphatase [Parvularcula sp. LCG005]